MIQLNLKGQQLGHFFETQNIKHCHRKTLSKSMLKKQDEVIN